MVPETFIFAKIKDMKRVLLMVFFFLTLASYSYSQVDYYTDLANEYEREYSRNKRLADKLDVEAASYLNSAKEYRRIADSCAKVDSVEQSTKYLELAEKAEKTGQSRLQMAQEARRQSIENFKLYQDALSKMLRARKREQEDLLRSR